MVFPTASTSRCWAPHDLENERTPRNTICLWYDGAALEAAQGDVLMVEFAVLGIPCLGLNGGPAFRRSEAFSFQVATDDQAVTDPDRAAAQRAFVAMMRMKKIDIAAIAAAWRG